MLTKIYPSHLWPQNHGQFMLATIYRRQRKGETVSTNEVLLVYRINFLPCSHLSMPQYSSAQSCIACTCLAYDEKVCAFRFRSRPGTAPNSRLPRWRSFYRALLFQQHRTLCLPCYILECLKNYNSTTNGWWIVGSSFLLVSISSPPIICNGQFA